MIVAEKPDLNEDLLMHFGVKGMKWGVRRERTPQEKLAKAKKAMSKIDADLALEGISYRGWGASKLNKRLVKKDPGFHNRKMSEAEMHQHKLRASRLAKRSAILRTTVEGGIVFAGGNVAVSRMAKPGSQTMRKGRIGVASLTALVGKLGYDQVRAINEADKMDSLRREIHFLEMDLYGKSDYYIR